MTSARRIAIRPHRPPSEAMTEGARRSHMIVRHLVRKSVPSHSGRVDHRARLRDLMEVVYEYKGTSREFRLRAANEALRLLREQLEVYPVLLYSDPESMRFMQSIFFDLRNFLPELTADVCALLACVARTRGERAERH